MGMNLNEAGPDFKRPPSLEAGTYPCRTVGIVDLGLQPQSYKGEEKAPGRMVSVTYEFADEFMLDEDGQPDPSKPRWLSESFVLYHIESEKAKSTSRYKALDPTNQFHGDFLMLYDLPCNVTIVLNPNKKNPDRPYENIASVSTMRPKDAAKAPVLVNGTFLFDLQEPSLDSFELVPQWMQKIVMKNLEFNGSLFKAMLEEGGKDVPKVEDETDGVEKATEDDEVPF